MYFCVNEFEVSVNDSMFSGNEQQKVYFANKSSSILPFFAQPTTFYVFGLALHFANTHQLLRFRQSIFCNQISQYTAVLDCMKALIAKLYLAAKQFLVRESWCVNKVL